MGLNVSEPSFERLHSLKLAPPLLDEGWIITATGGVFPDIAYSPSVNDHLLQGARFDFRLEEKTFSSGKEEEIELHVSSLRAKGKKVFDSSKVRLDSELSPGATARLSKTTYFQGLVTNDLCLRSYKAPNGDIVDGTNEAFPDGIIGSLEFSSMSNHLGGSALAFDSEGVLSLAVTASSSAVSSGKISPSASGSLDEGDFTGSSGDLIACALQGIARELMEEQSIEPGSIRVARMMSAYRDLARGGKPEFGAIIVLEAPWRELRTGAVDEFTSEHLLLDVRELGTEGLASWLSLHRQRCSSATSASLFMLLDAFKSKDSPIQEVLEL